MSRIFEAIQRADFERNAAQESDVRQAVDAFNLHGVEEPQQAEPDVDLEKIEQHRWEPVLVSLPTLSDRGAAVEQFRSLRSHISQLRFETPLKTILISSGIPGEGKSFVAVNLALSMARHSVKNVLLIDGDLRRGTLHSLLGAPNAPGLTDYLAGNASLMSVMQRGLPLETAKPGLGQDISNVTFIPAGVCGDSSSEFVSNHRMENLITTLSPYFDWIVIDSPPVLAVTDAVELARAADAVLLVARSENTPFEAAQRAQTAFANSRILGFVLNAVKKAPSNQSYSNYYGRDEDSGETQQGRKRGQDDQAL
jgi:capsular exopolysaccharide synthesis family protein